jgi:hypothetical protein
MSELGSHCEMCGRPMIRLHPAQRYCCRACSDEYFMAERRQAVAYFRAMGLKPELRNGDQQKEAQAR